MRVQDARIPVLAAVAVWMAAPALGQTKVALVDFQQALLATADMRQKAADLEAKFKPRQEELVTLLDRADLDLDRLRAWAIDLSPSRP